jgi:hypothetical protein
MADAAFSRRDFAGGAVETTITAGINSSDTAIAIAASTGWPSGTNGEFFVVLDEGLATEEKVRVDTRSGTSLTVTASGRGVDGTTAAAHTSGAAIRLCHTAQDADEANAAVAQLLAKATTAGMLPWVSAAQVYTMLAIGASGRVLISSGSAPTWQALSGDVTVTSGGVTAIGASKITNAMMADDAIDSAEIADGAIDTVHIGDLQVTTGKLAADAVTGAKIADDAVDTDQIADGAVTADQINDGAVQLGKLSNDSVPTAAIADDAVTAAKIAEAARPRWAIPGFIFTTANAGGVFKRASLTQPATAAFMDGYVVAIEAGSILGISLVASTARVSGSIVCEVHKNGVGTGLTVTLDGTNTTTHYEVQAAGTDTFVAGDLLSVVAAANDFGPDTAKLEATIWCQVT